MTDDELIEAMARAWINANDRPPTLFADHLVSARAALAIAKRELAARLRAALAKYDAAKEAGR